MLSASRRRLLWIVAALALFAGAGLGVRYWLGGYVVRSVLRLAGASQIKFADVRGTPWRLEVADLAFMVRTQPFTARRVTLIREKWWQASLGDVRVEGARLPVVLDRSDINPWDWATYDDGGLGDEPVQPPFRSLVLDGELVVRMVTLADEAIRVHLEGTPLDGTSWIGSLVAEGPGFRLAGGGSLLRAGQELDFQVHSAELDLGVWSRHVQRLVALPGGLWELQGRLTGVGEGKVTAKRFAATARVSLREGRMRVGARDVSADGIEADLEFSDLWKFRTKSGALRVAELRLGRLPLHDLTADFGLWNGKQLTIHRGAARALGGRVETDTFGYHLDQRGVAVTIRPAGVSLAALLGLVTGPVPRITGRAGGELALRIHSDGVQVDGGHLAVESGVPSELQLNAATMIRSGARMDAATQEIMKAAGGQSVVVRLDAFRLDVRPPDLPLGTTARVEASGRVDDNPVAFTYHVNGAIERYLRVMP